MLSKKLSKELIMYLVMGVLTTVVNFVCYFIFKRFLSESVSTIIAWFVSVLFAYITNRLLVFSSEAKGFYALCVEMAAFFGARIISGIFDFLATYIFIERLHYNDLVIKIAINVIVIVFNYVASKLVIFKKRKRQ